MPRRTDIGVKNDGNQENEKILFREPIVLITIIGLALLNGINMAVQYSQVYYMSMRMTSLWTESQHIFPVPGMIFFAFISEVNGRKPVYIIILALSILSSILHAFPMQEQCMSIGLVVQGVVRGGTLVINAVSISEYCSPKHRFAYMLAQVAALDTIGYLFPKIVLSREVLSNSAYLQSFQVVLGLVCLGSTWMWPESPYWLASKGRLEESRKAFLWLRGKEGEKELRSAMEERRRPGPPKLFWMSLAIAISTISVSVFSKTQLELSPFYYYYDRNHGTIRLTLLLCSCIVVFSVITFISYHIKRKLLFLAASGASFMLSYAIVIWMHLEPQVERESDSVMFYLRYLVLDVLLRCGSSAFRMVLFIEIIPQKYNTHMSCICLICYFIFSPLFMAFNSFLVRDFSLLTFVLIFVHTTLSLGGMILYYYFAPETKDKTLLEIQRMYTPEQSDANPEQNQIVMENIL